MHKNSDLLVRSLMRCLLLQEQLSFFRKLRQFSHILGKMDHDGPRDYMRQLARRYDRRFDIVFCQDVNYYANKSTEPRIIACMDASHHSIFVDERYNLTDQLASIIKVLALYVPRQSLMSRVSNSRILTDLWIGQLQRGMDVAAINFPSSIPSTEIEPPHFLSYLLVYFLPKEVREPFEGDLEEEYRETYSQFGKLAAQCWYFKQVITSIAPVITSFVQKWLIGF